jgi:glutaredoxin
MSIHSPNVPIENYGNHLKMEISAEVKIMRILFRIIPACFFLLLISFSAFSQVYKWRDKDGNLVVSMTPPPPGVKCEQQKVGDASQAESRANKENSSRTAAQEVDLARSNRDIKVILYITDWCPYCKKAKEYLNSLDVDLAIYDIEREPDKNAEFLEKGKNETGVPLIDVEGILMRGFSEKRIDSALEKRRHVVSNY